MGVRATVHALSQWRVFAWLDMTGGLRWPEVWAVALCFSQKEPQADAGERAV